MPEPPVNTEIGAFEVKTHLSQILDRVERGESITVTRRGKPVAEITPMRKDPERTLKDWLLGGPRGYDLDLPPRDASPARVPDFSETAEN